MEQESQTVKQNLSWNPDARFLVLPGEPVRKDLILEGFKSIVDVTDFLNGRDSILPKAVVAEGCCSFMSSCTKIWYAFYQEGKKESAMIALGLGAKLAAMKAPRSASSAVPSASAKAGDIPDAKNAASLCEAS